MKRQIIAGIIIVAIASLAIWGNRFVEKILDTELPQLLTRQLGITVTIDATRIRLSTLTVTTPQLVMGDPSNPALVATEVSVSLDWQDILRGELRLRTAKAATLMVQPSLWPSSNNPGPTDYSFLEPYLPDYLQLDSARYVTADGNSEAFSRALWRREHLAASLDWRQEMRGRALDLRIDLDSLDELLRLARMQLKVRATSADADAPAINMNLTLQPGETSGYSLVIDLEADGMSAEIATGNNSNWEFPDHSSSRIKQLDIEKLHALVTAYSSDRSSADLETLLASPLPRLSLPTHQGTLSIDEIRWHDEVAINSRIEFNTGPDGISIPVLASEGPEGVLQGQVGINSSANGWQLGLSAKLETSSTGKSLAQAYLDADWFWRQGSAEVSGLGSTWGQLLNSLQGAVNLQGSHRGKIKTPVMVTARLDNHASEFAIDEIEIKIAKGRIVGSAALSGDEKKLLSGKFKAEQLDLDFLLPETRVASLPGIELPTYLQLLPDIDLDLQLDLTALDLSSLNINQGQITVLRTPARQNVTANIKDANGGMLKLQLTADRTPGKPTKVTLLNELSKFSIAKLFQQASALADSRTSGTMSFSSEGNDIEEIFEAMRGKASLAIDHRPDQNWSRPPIKEQQLKVSGAAALVLENKRITGLRISKLAINSLLQNITGSVSIEDGRKPWLIADLVSDKLDLDSMAKHHQPPGTPDSSTNNFLDTLEELGEGHFSLNAKTLLVAEIPLKKVKLQVLTAPNNIRIEHLDFSLGEGQLSSQGEIKELNKQVTFSLDAQVDSISLEKLLVELPASAKPPLSGTIKLRSSGDSLPTLLADLTGNISLTAGPDTKGRAAGQINMTARRSPEGMHTTIQRFLWGGTDISGSVHYHTTNPPMLEVDISGGSLSLLPWQETDSSNQSNKKAEGSIVTRTAKASASMIGDVVMAPIKFFSSAKEADSDNKVFSTSPLSLDWMSQYDATIKGKIDSLTSREGQASDLELTANLKAGQFSADIKAGTINKGSATATIAIDNSEEVASLKFKSTFKELQGPAVLAGIPRSGYIDLASYGHSEAEMASNINGLVYLEMGAGTLDYSNTLLLTADVASNVFQTLIPGAEKKQPKFECAVMITLFKDGMGSTPYGYAARTDLANLVGSVAVDLKKELLHISMSSSSRKGMGLSLGNVFSNTVELEGPINNPKVVPNTSGILWRGWAAVMTGGLSLVGESVLKRTLASENPCETVQKHIRKDLCGSNPQVSASPMICPPS